MTAFGSTSSEKEYSKIFFKPFNDMDNFQFDEPSCYNQLEYDNVFDLRYS